MVVNAGIMRCRQWGRRNQERLTMPTTLTSQTTTGRQHKVLASELTFGIEMETTVPSHFSVGGYRNGRGRSELPTFNGNGWTTTTDSSITSGRGRQGCEFVSPILQGQEGLRNAMDVVRVIKARTGTEVCTSTATFNGLGARVNSSCGIHVHVGWPTDDRRFNLKALQRLIHLVAGFEKGIYASTGTKSRERGSWSRSIKGSEYRSSQHKAFAERLASVSGDPRSVASRENFNPSRYFGLNLSPLLSGRRNTVEFRFFSASLNPAKIAGFVQLCLGLVQTAVSMPRCAKWDAGPASANFGQDRGQGYRELNRLFTRLKWINRKSGAWTEAGMLTEKKAPRVDDVPTLRESISALRRMATKYDRES